MCEWLSGDQKKLIEIFSVNTRAVQNQRVLSAVTFFNEILARKIEIFNIHAMNSLQDCQSAWLQLLPLSPLVCVPLIVVALIL